MESDDDGAGCIEDGTCGPSTGNGDGTVCGSGSTDCGSGGDSGGSGGDSGGGGDCCVQ